MRFNKRSGLQGDYIIPDELIKDLKLLFPNSSPNMKDSDREIWYKAGQSSVVEYLEREKLGE